MIDTEVTAGQCVFVKEFYFLGRYNTIKKMRPTRPEGFVLHFLKFSGLCNIVRRPGVDPECTADICRISSIVIMMNFDHLPFVTAMPCFHASNCFLWRLDRLSVGSCTLIRK